MKAFILFGLATCLLTMPLAYAENDTKNESNYSRERGNSQKSGSIKKGRRGSNNEFKTTNKGTYHTRKSLQLKALTAFMENENIPEKTKKEVAEEFRAFQEKSYQYRLELEKNLYVLRKSNMEKMHTERLKEIENQRKLLDGINLTSSADLKKYEEKHSALMKGKSNKKGEFKEEKSKMKELREEFRKKIKAISKEFRSKLKEITAKYKK